MRYRVGIDRERCKGCELCVSVCPVGVLKMSKDMNEAGNPVAETAEPSRCIGCGRCARICGDCAIEISVVDSEETEPDSK